MSFRLTIPLILLVACWPASAAFDFRYDEWSRRWTLSNGRLRLSLLFTPNQTLEFESLEGLQGEGTWTSSIVSPTSLLRVRSGVNTIQAGSVLQLISQAAEPIPNGYRQTIVFRDVRGQLQFTLRLSMYEDQPVVRSQLSVRNLREERVFIEHADLLPWTLADGGNAFRTLRVNQWNIIPEQRNFEVLHDSLDTGDSSVQIESGSRAPHCSWFAVQDQTGRGVFAGWEFDGRVAARVEHSGYHGALRLSATISDLHHPLEANEEMHMPGAFLGLFSTDWDQAGFRTQQFTEAVLAKAPPDGDRFPYVAWDSWGYKEQIDETALRREAALAARLGFELFTVDLGWARRIGDWHEAPEKFPSGLRALSDYVHSLGMKFGLHFAFAEAAEDAPVLLNNPDWTSSETYYYFGALSLCPSNKPFKEWIVKEAIRMIDEYGVDWILQDGENMVKQCTKTTHTHDSQDSNYANSVEGINEIVREIQRARPHVAWENCADGGTMMTFNMVQNYVTSITNDASGVFDSRQAAYGATYPFPPRYANRYMSDVNVNAHTTRSFMFGGTWNVMNRLTELADPDLEFMASEILAFKRVRRTVQAGKVFHILPPQPESVDVLQGYNAANGTAVAVVTREGGAQDNYLLLMRGLDPATNYQVTFQDDNRMLSMTGLQLMRTGVSISLPEAQSAEIVYANPVE